MPDRLPQGTNGPILTIEAYRDGPLGPFLAAKRLRDLSHAPDALPAEGSQQAVFAPWLLQDIADYRYALQRWFGCLEPGGFLVVTVPHAFLHDRRAQLPSPWRPVQRRLYTPASLLAEVEEALTPNSYRIRWLGDEDAGYDYALGRDARPVGRQDIALVIERIAPPAWTLAADPSSAPAPGPIFEPVRTRIEQTATEPVATILLLKLDHLGDFIMSLPAIRALRAHFPAAHITLVVGSWNEALAIESGLADRVIPFDTFTRNPVEEGHLDMAARAEAFAALVHGPFDLAIDLRTFSDTRLLLDGVDATHRAGIGNAAFFPFLDIALPIDGDIGSLGQAMSLEIGATDFAMRSFCERGVGDIACRGEAAAGFHEALVWGPYRLLGPGDYVFQPSIDLNFAQSDAVLIYDLVVDGAVLASGRFSVHPVDIAFRVDRPSRFEFRLWVHGSDPVPDFRFRGGRLSKRGVATALHQSEYERLLVDLVAMRLAGDGAAQ